MARFDAADEGREVAGGTCSHAPGKLGREVAVVLLTEPLWEDEGAEPDEVEANCGPRIGGKPAVVRLLGRVDTIAPGTEMPVNEVALEEAPVTLLCALKGGELPGSPEEEDPEPEGEEESEGASKKTLEEVAFSS